jgi:hypothetical protein
MIAALILAAALAADGGYPPGLFERSPVIVAPSQESAPPPASGEFECAPPPARQLAGCWPSLGHAPVTPKASPR